jgi:adenine-specific DNA-methyltransferase
MSTVIISGSRSINKLPSAAIESLDKIMALNFDIVIGDASGVDTLVQQYLSSKNYTKVKVYYAFRVRNNLGFLTIPVKGNYTDRDIAMCKKADFGLAIWDGKSKGTQANIQRVPKTKVIQLN